MKGSKGKRSRTRKKLRKKDKSKPNQYLKDFEEGARVQVRIDPSSHRGMPHPRFHGQVGEVRAKRGQGYILKVTENSKKKELTVHPEHLKLAE